MAPAEVSWSRALKVWWSLMWRIALWGALAGGILGFVIGALGAVAGADAAVVSGVIGIGGMLLAIPVGIWCVRTVLQASWSDFQIRLVGKTDS